MNKAKQLIKPYYYALRSTRIYHTFNTLSNLFLRNNNLIVAFFLAKLRRNKIFLGKNVYLKNCRFEIHGCGNTVTIEDNCILSGLRIFTNSGNNKLKIGKGTIVNASKEQRTLFNPCDGGEIIIGENCLFSNNIEIHTTDYHIIMENGRHTNLPQNIHIGAHCWIGLQCLIFKGSSIADNVIIGARSIVNKDITESNVVVAGSPAKIVKRDIEWVYSQMENT